MKLKEIQQILQAEVICGQDKLETEVECAGASDLMSDVLAFGKPGLVLLTGLTNAQSVRTADIIEAKAIIYVRGKKPEKEGIELAVKKGIPMLSTKYLMYKACGILYQRGLLGISDFHGKK